jgi:immune inhibitor A
VTAKAWYDIEAGYDYLFAEYSTDAGAHWTQIGNPVDGSSNGRWSNLRYSVPGGQAVLFRFRYQTDGGVHLPGAFIDDINIKSGGTSLFFDDVETGDNGWTAVGGFKRSTGTEITIGDRYYLAENRTYVSYDETLAEGPYQFSYGITAPNKVERFPYQDGLLVWAIDETYSDNNTIEHPGHGLALPVDARPAPFTYPDGTKPGNRRQPFDATFGLQATDAVALHKEVVVGNGKNQTIEWVAASAPSVAGIPTFTDSDVDAYWSSANALSSALVAGHGVTITVTSQTTGGTLTVTVTNPD